MPASASASAMAAAAAAVVSAAELGGTTSENLPPSGSTTPSSGTSPSNQMVPAYYPVRATREKWPHQVLQSLAWSRSPERKLDLPAEYVDQIVDELGVIPADFDLVNAVVTRVKVNGKAKGQSVIDKADDCNKTMRSRKTALFSEVLQSKSNSSTNGEGEQQPPSMSGNGSDVDPDVLRQMFMDICSDQNSLEMLWHETVERYRDGWREYRTSLRVSGKATRSRNKIVDMFTQGMWQRKWIEKM